MREAERDRLVIDAFVRGAGRMPSESELGLLLKFCDDAERGLDGETPDNQELARAAVRFMRDGKLDLTIDGDGTPAFVRRPAKASA